MPFAGPGTSTNVGAVGVVVEVRAKTAILLTTVCFLPGCSGASDREPRADKATARTVAPVTTPALPWSDLIGEGRRQGLTEQLPRSVRAVCLDIATRAAEQGSPQQVFCPPLVPDTAVKVELAGGILRYRHFKAGYNIGFWSPDARDATEFGGHWSIAAGGAESLHVYTHPEGRLAPAGEERPRPIVPPSAKATLRGVPVTVYRMAPDGPGFYAGHIVFEWSLGATTFHLTMHGHEHESRTRIMAAALIEQAKACATERARTRWSEDCDLVFGRGREVGGTSGVKP